LELLAVILVAVNNMIPWGLLGQGVKAGLEIYKNKKAADVAMSEAKLLHIEKMKRGEIEFSGKNF
jgi:ribosomal protein L13